MKKILPILSKPKFEEEKQCLCRLISEYDDSPDGLNGFLSYIDRTIGDARSWVEHEFDMQDILENVDSAHRSFILQFLRIRNGRRTDQEIADISLMGLTYLFIDGSYKPCEMLNETNQIETISSMIESLHTIFQMSMSEAERSSKKDLLYHTFRTDVVYLLIDGHIKKQPDAVSTISKLAKTYFFKRIFENDYKQIILEKGALCHHSDISIPFLNDLNNAFPTIFKSVTARLGGSMSLLESGLIVPLEFSQDKLDIFKKNKLRKISKRTIQYATLVFTGKELSGNTKKDNPK